MNDATQDYIRPGYEVQPIPGFPHAPIDWTRESAEEVAQAEGLTLTEEHWQVVRALQEICTRSDEPAMSVPQAASSISTNCFPRGPWPKAACSLACNRRRGHGTRDSAARSRRLASGNKAGLLQDGQHVKAERPAIARDTDSFFRFARVAPAEPHCQRRQREDYFLSPLAVS